MTNPQESPTSPASSKRTYTLVIEDRADLPAAGDTLARLLADLTAGEESSLLPGFTINDLALGNVVQALFEPEKPA